MKITSPGLTAHRTTLSPRYCHSLAVPASKLTFASLGGEALERVMAESRPLLESSPSFAGFIVHSYESYRPLCEAAAP
jgi:hypothetical protein